MKIRSLTFLATLLFSHLAFADPTLDPCSTLAGQWSGQGEGQSDQMPAVDCIYGGSITVAPGDSPGAFVITSSSIDKLSGHKMCKLHVELQELKGTCKEGGFHADGVTKGGSSITLDVKFQSANSATLTGSMTLGRDMTATIKNFYLTKQ